MKSNQSSFKPTPAIRVAERLLTAVMRLESRRLLSLKPADVTSLPPPLEGHQYTLYAHVPFCESLCPYCSFNRFVLNQAAARRYFNALREEMRLVHKLGYRFSSLYIGGGTPTVMPEELAETIDLARQLFGIREVSCETNPNHLTPPIIDLLKERVQRLSVGVQSFDDSLLKQMNRYQKFGSGAQIFEKIQYAAPFFQSLNVDMIFNFPSQTAAMLREDIRLLVDSAAQQVTFYPLMTSPSVKRSMTSSTGVAETTREADYYRIIDEELTKAFEPLSAWTYARSGTTLIDEYIVSNEEYAAVGSGVFSYLDGTLYASTFSLAEYERKVAAGVMGVTGIQPFSRLQQMRYRLMLDMFGLYFNRKAFSARFGTSPALGMSLEMLFFNLFGAFKRAEPAKPTPSGRYYSLVIMREFFSAVNRLRDISRAGLNPLDRGELEQ